MKKLITLLLVLVISVSCAASFAETLSENEKNYLGAWTMYADNGKGTLYVFTIVFTDNMQVVQKSMTFKDGELIKDNKASGEWSGFTSSTIIFTLAGKGMTAMIKDDGYLYMYFFDDLSMCGAFAKCPDMTTVLGW